MKKETARICVTLPVEMLQDFKTVSEETDLSVSRLIYLRLCKREPILIVTEDVLREIQGLKELLIDIKCGNFLSHEAFAVLQARVRQFEKFVNMDDPAIVVHVKRR